MVPLRPFVPPQRPALLFRLPRGGDVAPPVLPLTLPKST